MSGWRDPSDGKTYGDGDDWRSCTADALAKGRHQPPQADPEAAALATLQAAVDDRRREQDRNQALSAKLRVLTAELRRVADEIEEVTG